MPSTLSLPMPITQPGHLSYSQYSVTPGLSFHCSADGGLADFLFGGPYFFRNDAHWHVGREGHDDDLDRRPVGPGAGGNRQRRLSRRKEGNPVAGAILLNFDHPPVCSPSR